MSPPHRQQVDMRASLSLSRVCAPVVSVTGTDEGVHAGGWEEVLGEGCSVHRLSDAASGAPSLLNSGDPRDISGKPFIYLSFLTKPDGDSWSAAKNLTGNGKDICI